MVCEKCKKEIYGWDFSFIKCRYCGDIYLLCTECYIINKSKYTYGNIVGDCVSCERNNKLKGLLNDV